MLVVSATIVPSCFFITSYKDILVKSMFDRILCEVDKSEIFLYLLQSF